MKKQFNQKQVPNLPSTTGKPSGKGRGNGEPAQKQVPNLPSTTGKASGKGRGNGEPKNK